MCFAVAFSALCCAGATMCNCVCSCCKSVCKTTFKQQVRLTYVIVTLICFLVSIFAMYGAKEMFSWFNDAFGSHLKCPDNTGGEYNCFGVSSLYRMSFTLMIMYAFVLSMLFTRGECAKSFNEGLWLAKIFFILGFYITCFFIPNSFFEGYVVFSQITSTVFMVLQSIMLIDIFYLWGQSWVAKFHNGVSYCGYVLVITMVILYGGIITLNVFNFIWYHQTENVIFNIINCILIVAATGIQLAGFNKYGSIITTGAISMYMTFLNFSAMLSSETNQGKQIMSNQGVYYFDLSIGVILIIIILMYMTFSNKQTNSNRVKVGQNQGLGNHLLLDENDEDIEDLDEESKSLKKEKLQELVQQQIDQNEEQKKLEEEMFKAYQNNQYIIFHIVMFIVSVYSTMLITNWASPDFNSNKNWNWTEYQTSTTSYWCKIITSWVTCLLYIWTLIAPAVFPDRDFS